jgi:hypothetical protein
VQKVFDAFVAWQGGAPPTATYRNALAVARSANNAKLRGATVGWISALLDSKSNPDADALGACKSIGQPIRFHGIPTTTTRP